MEEKQERILAAKQNKTVIIGNSFSNRELVGHVFEINSIPLYLHIHAAMHGDEPETEAVAKALIAEMTEGRIYPCTNVIVLPCINPDGISAGTRVNARGIDLNRNFPTNTWSSTHTGTRYFPGTSAASEPETKAVLRALEEYPAHAIISLHTWKPQVNYDGGVPAEKLARFIASFNCYEVTSHIGYPTPGSFGTYTGQERNISTITLEMPENSGFERCYQENQEALRQVLENYGPVPHRCPKSMRNRGEVE